MASASRSSQVDVHEAVLQIIHHFMVGALCPTDLWSQLADVLSNGDAGQILDALPPELQLELATVYRERPLSLLVLRRHPQRRQIKLWYRSWHDSH